ncbi:MAG TPA: protein kinase [Hyphomicrobiaceae bacterium]|nr:protein kinase [Hyphomicrobiaceae bacterium]
MAKASLSIGMVLDGFRLEERLHRGGMATIWRVTRPDIDDPIVMKVPFLDHEGDLSLLVGFEVEQMIMAELAGPHVPRFIANGDFTVQPYIVMERLPGNNLHKMLFDTPRLEIEDAISKGTAIAEALGDLHNQHVLHLDLKPANVLFRPSGEAVLIDFGLSRHLLLPDLLEEQFHRPTGTTEYMAPEQLARVRSDKRSDLFALGAIIYQMATGELPFGAPGRIKQVRQRVWRDPVPPRALRPELPAPLQEVIIKCLEPLPDKRYRDAEELVFDLRHLDLVELTERAGRQARADARTAFGRWMRAKSTLREIQSTATKPPPRTPIILVAVDLRPRFVELRNSLLEAAVSVLANMPGARLACLNVMETSLISIDENVDAAGDNIHVQRMAELRQWAAPLQLPRGKITYHLVEARNIAGAILDFARSNKVDHLVIGAPTAGGAAASRLTAQITAESPCSVSVVRASADRADLVPVR